MRIVLDSDVIVAGLISSKGAGNFLLNHFLPHQKVKIITTTKQIKEIEKVMNQPEFVWQPNKKLWQRLKKYIVRVEFSPALTKRLTKYLSDPEDIHILASAFVSRARFLLTYNLKHYQSENIKKDLDILVTRPGLFLQFWRLKEKV